MSATVNLETVTTRVSALKHTFSSPRLDPARVERTRLDSTTSTGSSCCKRVLVICGDAGANEAMRLHMLKSDEFAAEFVATAADAVAFVLAGTPIDVALVDEMLADMPGLQCCASLRHCGYDKPLLLLAGPDADLDEVFSTYPSPDDVIVKPAPRLALLARLRAHAGTRRLAERSVFRVGPYEFRPADRLLYSGKERRIALTEKESALLMRLLLARGRPVPRRVLLDQIWGFNNQVDTHTLETHVYRLRKKIEPASWGPTLLLTTRDGYQLAV